MFIFYRSKNVFVARSFNEQVPLGQAAISQVSSVLECGDPSKILRRLSSCDSFVDAAANGIAARNGSEKPHNLTKQKHFSSVGSFDVLDVENLYETGNIHVYCRDYETGKELCWCSTCVVYV